MLVYILVGVDTLVYVLAWAAQAPLRAPREERGEREEREERVTRPPSKKLFEFFVNSKAECEDFSRSSFKLRLF